MMTQSDTDNTTLLSRLVTDINAGKYKQLLRCQAAANVASTELFVQNREGFTACVPVGFIVAHDDRTVMNELKAQLDAWTGIGDLWTAEPANCLIH